MSRSSYFRAPALLALAAALLAGVPEATAEPEDDRPSLLRRLKPQPARAAATAPTPAPLAPAPVHRYGELGFRIIFER